MKIYITIIISIFAFYSLLPADAGTDQSTHKGDSDKKQDTVQIFPEPFRVNKPAPDFTLINQDGKRTGLKDFRGKVVIMNFIYTSCGETCPALITKFRDIQKAMKDKIGKEVILLSITIDPERDTPKVLKEYAKTHGANPKGWLFLTGTRKEIDKVLNTYRIIYEKDQKGNIGHVNMTILIDKQGVETYNFGGFNYPAKQVISKTEELLAKK